LALPLNAESPLAAHHTTLLSRVDDHSFDGTTCAADLVGKRGDV
jgi:hypothetical protein